MELIICALLLALAVTFIVINESGRDFKRLNYTKLEVVVYAIIVFMIVFMCSIMFLFVIGKHLL